MSNLPQVIVANSRGPTHEALIAELIGASESVLIASPFLFDDFGDWVSRTDFSGVRTLTIVTTIAPRGDDQLRKPAALLSLLRATGERWPDVRVSVQVDNRLHGKVYLFGRGGLLTAGIVTSANLTRSGLGANHEWGILVRDTATLDEVDKQIRAAVEYPCISGDLLRQMAMIAEIHRGKHPTAGKTDDVDVLASVLRHAPKPSQDPLKDNDVVSAGRRVFLKPWGTGEKPVRKADREDFSALEERLHYPRGRPTDVRPGDLIVAFATGDRCVLSLYRSIRMAEEYPKEEQARDPEAARWPWFMPGHNLTPTFGARWWEIDLTIDRLAEEFAAQNPSEPWTAKGNPTLGALNFGAGRLRLGDAFGEFVVRRLLTIEAGKSPA